MSEKKARLKIQDLPPDLVGRFLLDEKFREAFYRNPKDAAIIGGWDLDPRWLDGARIAQQNKDFIATLDRVHHAIAECDDSSGPKCC